MRTQQKGGRGEVNTAPPLPPQQLPQLEKQHEQFKACCPELSEVPFFSELRFLSELSLLCELPSLYKVPSLSELSNFQNCLSCLNCLKF